MNIPTPRKPPVTPTHYLATLGLHILAHVCICRLVNYYLEFHGIQCVTRCATISAVCMSTSDDYMTPPYAWENIARFLPKGKPKGKPIWVYLVTRLKAIQKQDSVIVKVGLE